MFEPFFGPEGSTDSSRAASQAWPSRACLCLYQRLLSDVKHSIHTDLTFHTRGMPFLWRPKHIPLIPGLDRREHAAAERREGRPGRPGGPLGREVIMMNMTMIVLVITRTLIITIMILIIINIMIIMIIIMIMINLTITITIMIMIIITMIIMILRFPCIARRHQICHFRRRAISAPAEGRLRTGSMSRDIANVPSELCRRRSGMFTK